MQNVKVMQLFFKAALKRGRGMPNAAEKLARDKIQRHQEKLEQVDQAVKHLLRQFKEAQPEGGLVWTVQVSYNNTLAAIRTRKQASGPSAQKFSQLHLRFLLPDVVDYDIHNCCFTILHQLIERLEPCMPCPPSVVATLKELATNRDAICVDKLGVTKPEGKQLLLEVFNGAHLAPQWQDNAFLKEVQKASFFCRWLACTNLPSAYVHCAGDAKRKQPDVSTLFFFWTAVEDYILQIWVEYLLQLRPQHLSLHYDGVRVDRETVRAHRDLGKAAEEHIATKTGFRVNIAEKHHRTLLEEWRFLAGAAVEMVDMPNSLRSNSIAAALYRLGGAEMQNKVVELTAHTGPESKPLRYKDFVEATAVRLQAQLSPTKLLQGSYLLHVEYGSQPHALCVGVIVAVESVTVWHAEQRIVLPLSAFMCSLSASSAEAAACVAFRVSQQGGAASQEACDVLLDLQAGADQNSDGGSVEGADDGDITVNPGADLLQKLRTEVSLAQRERYQKNGGRWRCPLCPFRSFGNRPGRVSEHIQKHHKTSNQFCASGTKQMKVVVALWDHDKFCSRDGENYLQRSATVLRASVKPPLKPSASDIDRDIRLVLTGTGPEYINFSAIADQPLRRARNIYYSRCFAHLVYMEMLLCDAKVTKWH